MFVMEVELDCKVFKVFITRKSIKNMYLKVKVAFDPPSSSFVLASFENQIKEMEWRLNVQAESVVKQNE